MYQEACGIIETLAPLHVGATAGEETGNLNLVFRDQFTQTGIIPGSSIRGRLRAEMEGFANQEYADDCYGRPASKEPDLQFESRIKMEHASIVWLPVFCPGQPIVWVSCPRLLRRYQRIMRGDVQNLDIPSAYTGSESLSRQQVFFNFGFVTITAGLQDLSPWFPLKTMMSYGPTKNLPAVVVADKDIAMIHDMALYRQSRVALRDGQKVAANQAFFNVEALPEGTLLIFPIAIKPPALKQNQSQLKETKSEKESLDTQPEIDGQPESETPSPTNITKQTNDAWKPLKKGMEGDIYLGGLESVGFGHCYLTVKLQDTKPTESQF